ncbi:MAG TPA: NYN domain-containing protein, partial [Hyphomicrobium sp.]|nr:NYN domain-containing protein [Hyphomicrobium sp.]
MKRESSGPILTTVFVDYDNVYLSLKRKNEEAAKRFSKDAGVWLKEIASGALMTATNAPAMDVERRIVVCRCYGNPVPRRNQGDNSTDMSSFPFVRHHFLRAGFEVVDCPPLTAQLKNSADIRMVMDVRDILTHETRFDEFVILSADADFTPVLHRLRAHARRTIIYSNDHTAAPYTAICDAEIREANFLSLLLDGQIANQSSSVRGETQALPSAASIETIRKDILTEVANTVRTADQPVPLEALADRCVRILGHDKTVGAAWGGTGSFRDLLARGLPDDIRLTPQPPYFVYDANRAAQSEAPRIESRPEQRAEQRVVPVAAEPARGESPAMQRALAPLFGAQPTQRPATLQAGAPAPAPRAPL